MRRFSAGWGAAALFCLTCLASCALRGQNDISYPVGDFGLTDQDGREVRAADLRGTVWIASFIFTRCSGPCPHVSATMENLQDAFAGEPDVRLVTFTVDPEYDTPEVLKRYAQRFHADPKRWLFLTGREADVYRTLQDGFKVGAAAEHRRRRDGRQRGNPQHPAGGRRPTGPRPGILLRRGRTRIVKIPTRIMSRT